MSKQAYLITAMDIQNQNTFELKNDLDNILRITAKKHGIPKNVIVIVEVIEDIN